MDFATAVITCLRKYADLRGRASRAEFWWFTFSLVIVGATVLMLEMALSNLLALTLPLTAIYGLIILTPFIAVTVRRLHDLNKSGVWCFLSLVPVLGQLALFAICMLPGSAKPNAFGKAYKEPFATLAYIDLRHVPPMPAPKVTVGEQKRREMRAHYRSRFAVKRTA